MTNRRVVTQEVSPIRIDWTATLGKMEVGDKFFVKDCAQAKAGGQITRHNKNGRRFVTKKAGSGVQIIRVA